MRLGRFSFLIVFLLGAWVPSAFADNFSSSNFTVEAPVIAEPAAYGSSSSYGLWGAIPNITPTPGESTNFGINGGFLSYSGATMPELSVDEVTRDSVGLSWTATTGTVAPAYEAGIAEAPGGPYTFNSRQTTRTALFQRLSPSTPYYFIIRVTEQGDGTLLGYSNEVGTVTERRVTIGGSGSSMGTQSSSSLESPPPDFVWIYDPQRGLILAPAPGTTGTVIEPGIGIAINPALFRQFGTVVDTVSGEPIKGATVRLWRLNFATGMLALWPTDELATVRTDEFGLYSFLVPAGTYRISVDVLGYFRYMSGPVTVDRTGQFEQHIELTRSLSIDLPWFWLMLLLLIASLILFVMIIAVLKFIFRR